MAKLETVIGRGLASARPASAAVGALYFSTDTELIERWSGSTWETYTPSATVSTEAVQDIIGAALVEGAGIDLTYDDAGAGTVTIATTITQYTDEMARDALGTALVAGSNVTITPNDGSDTITIAATGGGGGGGNSVLDALLMTWQTGKWYGTPESLPASADTAYAGFGLAANSIVYAPIYVPASVTVDRIGCYVTTGSAGTVRLGIYETDAATWKPGALLLDAGTVDTAASGDKEITISQALTGGAWYWGALLKVSGSAGVRYSNTSIRIPHRGHTTPGSATPTATVVPQFGETGTSLPATATPVEAVGGAYLVRLRAS